MLVRLSLVGGVSCRFVDRVTAPEIESTCLELLYYLLVFQRPAVDGGSAYGTRTRDLCLERAAC